MSEGIADGGYAPTPSRSQPAYGEGRLAYEPSAKVEEALESGRHAALALAIFCPAAAAYAAMAYALYLAVNAII
jgi:hypothetical protein